MWDEGFLFLLFTLSWVSLFALVFLEMGKRICGLFFLLLVCRSFLLSMAVLGSWAAFESPCGS